MLRILYFFAGPAKIISAAVQHAPWAGADGTTLNDVSAFAESLTYINIMYA